MTIYLSGPMTGMRDYNRPLFNKLAASLRKEGKTILNPAEFPTQDTWESYMRYAIGQLVTADAILLLPGWPTSKGAMLELNVAHAIGLPVMLIHTEGE